MMISQLDAVEHVHAHGLVHCDIKPSNFLFTLDGSRLKLIDFGLARSWRDSTTGVHIGQGNIPSLLGTVHYASIPIHRHHSQYTYHSPRVYIKLICVPSRA